MIHSTRSKRSRRPNKKSGSTLAYQTLEPKRLLAISITEIAALNVASLEDGYLQTPDWIELHNSGPTAVDLQGYHLTDDPNDPIGWTFETSTVIDSGEYLIVFASSRNEIDPAGYHHTDFKLTASGEYVGLLDDSGNLLSEIGSSTQDFPAQIADVTYGSSGGLLVSGESVAEYLIPSNGNLGTSWTANNFNAAANGFTVDRAALGYENAPNSATSYASEILTTVPSGTTNLYVSTEFEIADASAVSDLTLGLKYDDGVGVYLNGTLLFSQNANNGLGWNTTASATHNDSQALNYVSFGLDGSPGSVGNFLNLLQDGTNTLAIHALNQGSGSSDFLISPRLSTNSLGSGAVSHLLTPTPGAPNSDATTLGPAITNVTPNGTVVNPGQTVFITAEISQFDLPVDTTSVRLRYRVDFGSEITVSMNDSGIGGDLVAGDGIFTGRIINSQLTPGRLLRWYVTADDIAGNESRAPLFFDPLNSPEYFGTVVTDPSINTDLPLLQWFVENPSAAQTRTGTRGSLFIDGEFYDNIQTDLHGQSTATNQFSKKSFNFDANSGEKFDVGSEIGIASDFNLLTNQADQTKLRHPLAYEFFEEADHIASLTGEPVLVYRNGSFYGLFDAIEDGDTEFLERAGLDPDGSLYKVNNPLNSTTENIEKNSRKYEDNSEFQAVVDANNLTGTAASIWDFDNLDVATLVNYVAVNSIIGNWDFGHKNMYWYLDSEGTGLWYTLPWDVDLSFGHQWNGSHQPNPYFDNTLQADVGLQPGLADLYRRVYSDPVLSEMFWRRLRTLSDQFYGEPGTPVAESWTYNRLNEIEARIADEVAQDTAFWGIHPDFAGSFPFNPADAVDEQRDTFIPVRRALIDSDFNTPNSQVGNPGIRFDTVNFDANPASGLQSEEYIRLNNPTGSAVDISGWELDGGIEHTFHGGTVIPAGGSLYVVKDVAAFKARSVGPTGGQQLFIQGNYSGQIANTGETIELLAADGVNVDTLTTPNSGLTQNQQHLRVSEINYNPSDQVADAEFIELLNTSTTATLDLSGVAISEGPSVPFVFANSTTLAPGERLLVVQDLNAFTTAYPSVSTNQIAGVYSGKLSNSGETIRIDGSGGERILEFDYGDSDPWHFGTDGEGQTLQLVDETNTSLLQLDKFYSWRPSHAVNGTPGAAPASAADVVINEVLAHTDSPDLDSIELFNPTNQSVVIGGWYLSDSSNDLLKYQIPLGTVLGAQQYIVFDESDFNPTPLTPGLDDFSLSSSNGDEVWLTIANGAVAETIVDQVEFGATFNGESLGRLPDGTGRLSRLDSVTLGSTNSGQKADTLVISEVNYHPADPTAAALAIEPTLDDNDLEFIEIFNPTSATVSLTDWRLRGDSDFDFAAGTTLAAGQAIVVVNFDPSDPLNASKAAAFRATYGLSSSVPLVGGLEGNLSNNFARITLQQPDAPAADGSIPHVMVDEIVYDDLAPWANADGSGQSLNRIGYGDSGNLASNWSSLTPTPGVATAAPSVAATVLGSGTAQRSTIESVTLIIDGLVTLDPDAVNVIQRSDASGLTGNSVGTTYTTNTSGGNTVVTVSFTSSTRNGNGALADGYYELTLDHTKVRSVGGNVVMAQDYVLGSVASDKFYSYFGEISNDTTVSSIDLLGFRQTFRRSAGDPVFNADLDYDGNGTISSLDLLQFRQRFRRTLSWF